MRAPAPTPISPERYGQYTRTPQAREHSTSIASRHMRRWETLSSVCDQDEPPLYREALRSPEGEGDELPVEPVFITEDVLTRDPNLTPLSNRKDMEEWPQEKMIINIIENGDEMSRSGRSPSPGSKTYIPHDILAEFHGDLYGRKVVHIAGQKMTGSPNIAKEFQGITDTPAYIAPAWRPPRSRTPIQFSETPSRRAPKPLRQPPAESVPRSLTVQSFTRRVLQRPKSTPPRISSPKDSRDLPVQQVLSDSSLVNSTRADVETYPAAMHACSPSVDACGAIPPPPSPEAQMFGTVVPSALRLDPVSEAEEKSSLASASFTDELEGRDNAVQNLSEVEEEGDEADFNLKPGKVYLESKTGENVVEGTETSTGNTVTEQRKEVEDPQTLNSQPAGEDSLSIKDKNAPPVDTILSDQTQTSTKEAESIIGAKELGNQEEEAEKKQDEISTEINTTADESRDKEQHEEEATVPPHPPGSPDITNTPDFTEGLDMNLDLEAELRAAMEGLDDLDDNEAGEKRASPELEAW